MSKLAFDLIFDLTPEQVEQAKNHLEKLERKGGMLLGSLQTIISDDFEVRRCAGFRWVEVETAEILIEIANPKGEKEDA